MLVRIASVAENLKKIHSIVTTDLAIHIKAQDMLWPKLPLLDGKFMLR